MAFSHIAGKVQTVLGPVSPEELGITLPHEHLVVDLRPLFQVSEGANGRAQALELVGLQNHYELTCNWTSNPDNLLLDEKIAIEEALLYRWEGGQAIADVSPPSMGRDPLALQRVARATGLHIIMGAGYYSGRIHPADMDAKKEEDLSRELVREVTEGIGDTGVRSGLIGEIGCSWPITPNERKVLRAAAEAAKETGAPLMIHPGLDPAAPEAHLEEVRKTGLDLRRVIMAHMDHVEVSKCDRAWLRAIAETGCFLAYDHFGKEVSHYPSSASGENYEMISDAERIRQILWLLEQGYGQQIHLSHDIALKVKLVILISYQDETKRVTLSSWQDHEEPTNN